MTRHHAWVLGFAIVVLGGACTSELDDGSGDAEVIDESAPAPESEILLPPARGCGPRACPGGKLWGIGEPIAWNFIAYPSWTIDRQIDQVLAMGATVFRSWPVSQYCFHTPETYDAACVARAKRVIHRLKAAGVAVVQMEGEPQPWITEGGTGKIPCRDLRAGSRYMLLMDRWRRTWVTLGTLLDEVDTWEVGNEWNNVGWLRPDACDADGQFSYDERVLISGDLMYWARQGLRSVRPNAFMFSVSPAPVDRSGRISLAGIGTFFEALYQAIERGAFPSRNKRDFFDGLAWHPYVWADPTVANWVQPNLAIHRVIEAHGDGALPVFFSEVGNYDDGNFARTAANADTLLYSRALSSLYFPWLWGTAWFRMLDDPHATWGSPAERTYGVMESPEDGFNWKLSAFAMWSINKNQPSADRTVGYELSERGSYGGFTPVNVATLINSGGWLLGVGRQDPQLVKAVGIDPRAAGTLEVSMASWSGSYAQLFFATVDAPGFSEARSVQFAIVPDGRPHVYRVPMAGVPGWRGIVNQLRFDPTEAPGQFMLDSLRFTR